MTLWIEKYRPGSFDEIIGQSDAIAKLRAMVGRNEIQHMMLSGPPGVGKTTSALVLAKAVFGKAWRENFIELNASDDRKLSVIQGKVKEFARSRPIDAPFKILLFDEADSLTTEAQQALRRMMEEYSATCRFVFSVNYQNNMIEPIQSRCVILRFQPLSKADVVSFIDRIAKEEGLIVDNEAKDALYNVSNGDLRALVNVMQSLSNVSKTLKAETVYKTSGIINLTLVENALKSAVAGDYTGARKVFTELLDSGINIKELINRIFDVIINRDIIGNKMKTYVIEKLAETDYRIVEGATPFIQFQAFLAFLSTLNR